MLVSQEIIIFPSLSPVAVADDDITAATGKRKMDSFWKRFIDPHLTGIGRISFLIFHASIPASETHVSNTTEADSIKIKDGQV